MTSSEGRPPSRLTVGGRLAHEVVAASAVDVIPDVLAELQAQVPVYQRLPAEQLAREIGPVVQMIITFLADALRTDELPGQVALRSIAESAERRAEEGIPLAAVLMAYHVGTSVLVRRMAAQVTAADVVDLPRVLDVVLQCLARCVEAVTTAYTLAAEATFREDYVARQSLFEALLEGRDVGNVAARVGLSLPERYAVVAMTVGPHPDELSATVDASIAARRKIRRIRHELSALAPQALVSVTPAAATVLIPLSEPRHDDRWLAVVLRQVQSAAGVPILSAVTAGSPADVPSLVTVAGDVLRVATLSGHTEGVVRLDDVLVPFQLSRVSAATEALAALLAPLDDQPDLHLTLQAFVLRDGMNRRRAAARLHVHPNTVDYRLRRVAKLTGLDATDPAQAQTLMAALAARAATAKSEV